MTPAAILQRHAVRDLPGGPGTLVLAHGFGCSQAMWRHVAPAFAGRRRVLSFDYIGAGQADRAAYAPAHHATLAGYASDVVDILQAADLHDVCFVGHSVSAMIGALAAVQAPGRIGRLVMIAPSACYLDDPPYAGGFRRADLEGLIDLMDRNDLGWASFLASTVMQNPEREELSAELRDSLCALDPSIARDFACATFFGDHRALLPQVRQPCLVLRCREDPIAPPAAVQHVADQLPQARLVDLQASGHSPHMSHPAEVIAAIEAFLGD